MSNDGWGICKDDCLEFEISECRVVQERSDHLTIIDDLGRAHHVLVGKAREAFERRRAKGMDDLEEEQDGNEPIERPTARFEAESGEVEQDTTYIEEINETEIAGGETE